MSVTSEHTHHIKLRSTQLEMPTRASSSATTEDYDSKLQAAQDELERIQLQREELERKKLELEDLTSRKRAFVAQQAELTEKTDIVIDLD